MMNIDWQQFLQQQGGIAQNAIIAHFGKPTLELQAAAQRKNILCSLDTFSTFRVTGEDASTFLQSLLSNDIRLVTSSSAQYSSLNSAKGRVLATLLIWRDGADYLIQLPSDLSEPIRKKLSMYVLRAKVKITDESSVSVTLGATGSADNFAALKQIFTEIPTEILACSHTSDTQLIRIDNARVLIHTTLAQAKNYWLALQASAQAVGSTCWAWLDIHAGIPVILPPTQEQFVAQMINLDLINAVNFKKGCYPGQEIVARMQYLGKLKRRMYLAHIDSTEAPLVGAELFSDDLPGQATGGLVNVAPHPDAGFDVLAVVQISTHDSHSVHLNTVDGVALQFHDLPYTLA